MAGHGPKRLDDYLDVFLLQRIEVGHLGSGSNTAGIRNESAQEARIPVFRYAARRIKFRPECRSNAIDCVTFQAMSDEQLTPAFRAIGIQAG
jgi:hypothetical protein